MKRLSRSCPVAVFGFTGSSQEVSIPRIIMDTEYAVHIFMQRNRIHRVLTVFNVRKHSCGLWWVGAAVRVVKSKRLTAWDLRAVQ